MWEDIRMVAFDLDGTLLNDLKQITRKTMSAFEAAARMDIELVVASGRALEAIPPELMRLSYIRYFILLNGAQIYDSKEKKIIFSLDITSTDFDVILDEIKDMNVICTCGMDGKYCIDAEEFDAMGQMGIDPEAVALMQRTRKRVPGLKKAVSAGRQKIQIVQLVLKEGEDRIGLMEHMKTNLMNLSVTSSHKNNVEIGNIEANKGNALSHIASRLHMGSENVAAIGDSFNDISMIMYAGCGVAVANAVPSVKKYADVVGPDNNSDAVAWAINNAVYFRRS